MKYAGVVLAEESVSGGSLGIKNNEKRGIKPPKIASPFEGSLAFDTQDGP